MTVHISFIACPHDSYNLEHMSFFLLWSVLCFKQFIFGFNICEVPLYIHKAIIRKCNGKNYTGAL